MKVSTPSISWHNRERISSIDFQGTHWPNEKHNRLASGGDDKHVVIWDSNGSLNCLADLNRHQNSVNVVRWSKDGKYLASGDTDSAIYLWHFLDYAVAPDLFGEDLQEEEVASENWTVWKILRGHLQDVVSLDWSSCGTLIVSSSTDNTAIIYDVVKGSKLKILSDHKGWVNGVTFDPLGKFVASICSDRVLRVYDTKSYKTISKTYKCKLPIANDNEIQEKSVRLFHDDTFQSFYRRIDFSPDGQLLIVPSGVLEIEQEPSISHCTYLFSRVNFSKPVLYLPNKEFSVAVRFSPILYELRPVPNDEDVDKEDGDLKPWEKYKTLFALPYRMIYAVATQNTVMFYDTQQATPFARVSKIHYIGLTDLSWSADGHTCIVSSTDGYASFIEFQKGELGKVYSAKKTVLDEIPINVSLKAKSGIKEDVDVKGSISKKKDDLKYGKKLKPVNESNTNSKCESAVGFGKETGVSEESEKKTVNIISVRKAPKVPKLNSEPPSKDVKPNSSSNQRDESNVSMPIKSVQEKTQSPLTKAETFEKSHIPDVKVNTIQTRKAPKESMNNATTPKVISIKKTPETRRISVRKASKNNSSEASDCTEIKLIDTKTPTSSQTFLSDDVKYDDSSEMKTPILSGSLPSKALKRVQLITLSKPNNHDDEEEFEDDDLKLFLEDDKSQGSPNCDD
ncbi:chromatin assembly factor 1 subunit B isoform X2 [Lepeophtheirus salmonis]|uniref:chromatin assembly factor 1 subunit B isoform X2 n=1 Tax=Lepeophtheirus salmonis TaxID=72036 RepID=UPI001AE180C3|nr:chromatin assembly factor 1 subunit B-like isoform X2 [Lepeophtheirus salmonis]